jgi:glyoxylate utilization-related uncharacterized protein
MTAQTTSLAAPAAWKSTKPVLSSKSASAAVHFLNPGAALPETSNAAELVLYVAQGELVATVGVANFILNCDETLLVPAGRAWSARNASQFATKLFALVLPPRRAEPAPTVFPS